MIDFKKKTTYFKDIRENATKTALNNSEYVYNTKSSQEYIRRQLQNYIGELNNGCKDCGINVQYGENDADTYYTITLKAAFSYIKAYKTQSKYCEAIENISNLYNKFDKYEKQHTINTTEEWLD